MPPKRPSLKNAPLLDTNKLLSALVEKYGEATRGAFIKGLIHNLNGGIQILEMQIEMLQRMLAKAEGGIPSSIQEQANKCLQQIERFKALIDELLPKEVFEDQEEPQLIQLNDLLNDLLSFLKNNLFFKHQVRVEKFLTHPLPPLKGSYQDYCQGLLNFILNAIEAMENSPKKVLTIATEKMGDSLQVTIKDTGCGLAKGMKSHLFTPFFTTKGGRHKGLGLFISKNLLAKYGATFDYSFQEGETVFKITFPIEVS